VGKRLLHPVVSVPGQIILIGDMTVILGIDQGRLGRRLVAGQDPRVIIVARERATSGRLGRL